VLTTHYSNEPPRGQTHLSFMAASAVWHATSATNSVTARICLRETFDSPAVITVS
jgi:hypothetical protein